jgi:hypothetical protein
MIGKARKFRNLSIVELAHYIVNAPLPCKVSHGILAIDAQESSLI